MAWTEIDELELQVSMMQEKAQMLMNAYENLKAEIPQNAHIYDGFISNLKIFMKEEK